MAERSPDEPQSPPPADRRAQPASPRGHGRSGARCDDLLRTGTETRTETRQPPSIIDGGCLVRRMIVHRRLLSRCCPAQRGFHPRLNGPDLPCTETRSETRTRAAAAGTVSAMATTFADLEARVRGLESRAQRTEEDVTAIVTTVVEIRDDVKWLKRATQALLTDRNLTVPEDEDED